jgi:hypothetical protein
VQLLGLLLDEEEMSLTAIAEQTRHFYRVRNPQKALTRDLNYLIRLQAISAKRLPDDAGFLLSINLGWPTKITETEFFRQMKEMPKGKVYGFLSI